MDGWLDYVSSRFSHPEPSIPSKVGVRLEVKPACLDYSR